MNATARQSSVPPAACEEEILARLGFSPAAGGLQRGPFRFLSGARWHTLETQCVRPEQCRLIRSGSSTFSAQPGLWKCIGVGANHRRVFALPTALLNSANAAEAFAERDITALEASMAWALKTAGAHVGLDWETPSRAIIQSWFAPEQLTVLAGALVRQGELLYEPSELAIRFPIVPQLPPDLPEERLAWIRLLLDEAQNRWHLVRFGIIGGETESSVIAEVNLTGAPREILEDLFVTSLEALRWVVRWLGEPTDWLADVGVTSELLAVGPNAEP